jgi:hypothetical protein
MEPLMISWAVAAALAVQAQATVTPVYTLKQSGGAPGYLIDETVVLAGGHSPKDVRGTRQFWIAEQWRTESGPRKVAPDGTVSGSTKQYRWIDSRTCPALADVVQQLNAMWVGEQARLEMAARVGLRQIPTIPSFHARLVSVTRLPGDAPGISDWGGPWSAWWLRSEESLESCWQEEAPLVDGHPATPLIASKDAR